MKRTSLVLDERLAKEALRLTGEKTLSAAVNKALAEMIRGIKARRVLRFTGSGIWSGNLAEMRDDRPRRRVTRNSHATR
jgi:Arc/MetJ family transcription regulator